MNTLDARLLAALRDANVHLPASDLAAQLDVPEAIVRTRMAELRAAGFDLDERPEIGFRLLAAPDRLIADELAARLGPSRLVQEIVVFEETGSTNDAVIKRGRQGASAGLAIFAERQSAGRGRFGRRWESASHRGLWFSLLMRPQMPAAKWTRLTTWAAVSIAKAIERAAGMRVEIKWPNDIHLSGRKIAGILVEGGRDAAGQPFAVVGIGVNVNHQPGEFPSELAERATSIRATTGRACDRAALAVDILGELESRCAALDGAFSEIIAEAGARSVLLGRWVQLRFGNSVVEGLAEELDADGHLLLRAADGSLERMTAGEVTIIGSEPAA